LRTGRLGRTVGVRHLHHGHGGGDGRRGETRRPWVVHQADDFVGGLGAEHLDLVAGVGLEQEPFYERIGGLRVAGHDLQDSARVVVRNEGDGQGAARARVERVLPAHRPQDGGRGRRGGRHGQEQQGDEREEDLPHGPSQVV